jgi:polyketide cyclase/dehydrase/lipid transport protein
VFTVLSDVEQNPRWSMSAIDSHMTSVGPVGVGSTAIEVSHFLGRRLEVHTEVVAFERDRLLRVYVTGGPFPLHATFYLDPVDNGCQVMVSFEARPTGVLRIADAPFAIIARRKFAADLANLKRVLEATR